MGGLKGGGGAWEETEGGGGQFPRAGVPGRMGQGRALRGG